jgi:hypothetical protein
VRYGSRLDMDIQRTGLVTVLYYTTAISALKRKQSLVSIAARFDTIC